MFRTRNKYKLVLQFFGRPIPPFAVQFFALGPLILAEDPLRLAGGYLFVLPFLLLFLAFVNLPFIFSAFRAFRMDDATRRNHALEHATLHYLEQLDARRLSGRAARNGFWITGRASLAEIRSAFQKVRDILHDGGPLPHISRRCGSNVVTTLGLGLLLLLVVAVGSVVFQPPLIVRASALAFVVLFFAAMRHGIGNLVQRRFFMKVDFEDVSLRDVRHMPEAQESRGPVHFVETIVRPKVENAR